MRRATTLSGTRSPEESRVATTSGFQKCLRAALAKPAKNQAPGSIPDLPAASPLRRPTRIRLAIHPPHLGEVWVDLSIRGSAVRGRVTTESEAARDLILGHLDHLRRSLESQGVRVGDLQVAVDSRGDGSASSDSSAIPAPAQRLLAGPGVRSARRQLLDVVA